MSITHGACPLLQTRYQPVRGIGPSPTPTPTAASLLSWSPLANSICPMKLTKRPVADSFRFGGAVDPIAASRLGQELPGYFRSAVMVFLRPLNKKSG